MNLSGFNANAGWNGAELPLPGKHALAHSRKLTRKIQEEINVNNDSISFRRYMEMTLYEPGLGYYSAGAGKFGAAGDFITAPELSPLFSRCLARQCEEVLRLLHGGVILELGAGTGTMACDLLEELGRRDCLPEKYLVLETSADLRERQQCLIAEQVPAMYSRIAWLDSLPAAPFRGLIIANEVIDALPVHRIVLQEKKIKELCVAFQDDRFVWVVDSADESLSGQARGIQARLLDAWPNGYTTEVNTGLDLWLGSLAGILQQGMMLFIDYGYPGHEYYHPQRTDGTLLCHYRHRAHADPFWLPGLQDITASVDFTAVAAAAVAAGLDVQGFTSQAFFLMGCGLEEFIAAGMNEDQRAQIELSRQAGILTSPADMGERFKVIALGKDFNNALLGFRPADQRGRL